MNDVMAKLWKANQANGLWDLHRAQVRVGRLKDTLVTGERVAQASQANGTVGGASGAALADDEMFGVDSFNQYHQHPTVVLPTPHAPAPFNWPALLGFLTAALLAFLLLVAILVGAWLYISKPSPKAPTPPTIQLPSNEWDVGFFTP